MAIIVWEGPSAIDGSPIFCALTRTDTNSKLTRGGREAAVQAWFLTREHPMDALNSGRDHGICGDCEFRPWSGGKRVTRTCYVNLMPVISVWRSATEGGMRATPAEFFRRTRADLLRIGAYGDPAAAPYELVRSLAVEARAAGIRRRTGYTAQWRAADQRLRHLLMASCVGTLQGLQARLMGWRPFVVEREGVAPEEGLFSCPASAESGHRLTCAECGACDGVDEARHPDMRAGALIQIHGSALGQRQRQLNDILTRHEALACEGNR